MMSNRTEWHGLRILKESDPRRTEVVEFSTVKGFSSVVRARWGDELGLCWLWPVPVVAVFEDGSVHEV